MSERRHDARDDDLVPRPDRLRDLDAAIDPAVPGQTLDAPGAAGLRGAPAGWTAVTRPGRRGGHAGLGRTTVRLQAQAGNAAVAGLLGGHGPATPANRGHHRAGPTTRHAADGDPLGATLEGTAAGGEEATPLDDTAAQPPVPTASFTKVGPPSPTTYTVSGTLRAAANAVAARKEAGATIVTPDLLDANDGKRMKQAQVTVTQVVELPEWSDRPSATDNQKAEWDRFKKAITAHEAGHVATDVKSYANAHTKILAKKTLAESNAEYDRIVDQAKADNDTFDTTTDHGRNQGTTINPNIDEVTKVP